MTEISSLADPSRRRLLRTGPALLAGTVAGALGAGAATRPAFGEDYPSRPIRIVVPVPPGAGPDVNIRQIAQRLGPLLGQPVVVENRPGAAGRIATDLVAKSAPDGYTFVLGTPGPVVLAPMLYSNLTYDPKTDLVPVSLVTTSAYALVVNAAVPATDAKSYVALTRGRPEFANVATMGPGSTQHLTGEWFNLATHAQVRPIHYNTSAPYPDVIGGQVPAIFEALLPLSGSVRQGRLKVLAISGRQRSPLLPDVPTFAEAGYPAFDPLVWIGLLAPAGTPAAIVAKISDAVAQVARQPDIVAQRRDAFSESVGSTPQAFAAFLDAERAKWGEVARLAKVSLEK